MTENSGLSSSAPLRNLCLRVRICPVLLWNKIFRKRIFGKVNAFLGLQKNIENSVAPEFLDFSFFVFLGE